MDAASFFPNRKPCLSSWSMLDLRVNPKGCSRCTVTVVVVVMAPRALSPDPLFSLVIIPGAVAVRKGSSNEKYSKAKAGS
jgi:hypothetical protein